MIVIRGKVRDHPRQHGLPRRLWDLHAGHEEHRAGQQLDPISRNAVAFRVARLDDHGLPRETRGLFAPYPRHFTAALPTMVRAACFVRGSLPRGRIEK
ncbi:MAG: hypothetical protein ACK55I_48530, partial [bacterium]